MSMSVILQKIAMPFASFCSLHLYGFLYKIINMPFKPIMQSQWNFVSIELIQIAGSELRKCTASLINP